MHLGQTATVLADLLNRPEPKTKMVSRLLRENGWIRKGPRGRNAAHIDSMELAGFIIAFMACPDSPAVAMERLPHFAALPLEDAPEVTFQKGLATLLDRISGEDWPDVRAKGWRTSLAVDMSNADILADPTEGSGVGAEAHYFSSLVTAPDDRPMIDSLPFFGGLQSFSKIDTLTLFRIAKMILADEPDPLEEISKSMGVA